MAALIFERDLELGAVGLDLAVGDDEVLLNDLGHTQLAQMLAGKLDRVLGGFLPGFGAGAGPEGLIDPHPVTVCHDVAQVRAVKVTVDRAAIAQGSREDEGAAGKGADKAGSTASMNLSARVEPGDTPGQAVLVGEAAVIVNGKSVALDMLEDLDFYCVDNIPAGLLPGFIAYTVRTSESSYRQTAVGVDVAPLLERFNLERVASVASPAPAQTPAPPPAA